MNLLLKKLIITTKNLKLLCSKKHTQQIPSRLIQLSINSRHAQLLLYTEITFYLNADNAPKSMQFSHLLLVNT